MKKFFKILMVLALLSGAALSCTKDYSKEIADVQKQNQELDGLIAALQNALNSTNTTVSQISALTGKNEADITALVSANAEAFAEIIASHADDVEYLEELIAALEAAGVKQGEEIYAAIDALKAARAQALADAIIALEGKIAAGDEAAAKVAADALDAAVEQLGKDIKDGDDAAAKAAADALKAAVEQLGKDIKDGDDAAAKVAADALKAAVEQLGKDIKDGDDAAAKVAADALKAAVAELETAIEEGDDEVAAAAQAALEAAVAKLETAIAKGDANVTAAAQAALEAAVAEIETAIEEGDDKVAAAAQAALDAAVAKLETAIAEGDAKVAAAAQAALDAAVAKLETAIAEGDAEVAAAAQAALEAAEKSIREDMAQAIADGDKAVEDAAEKALAEAKTALEGKIDSEIATLKKALADEIARAKTKEDAIAADFAAQIAALATKTTDDIKDLEAKINEALAAKADKSDVQDKYNALSGMIETLQAGLKTASSDIAKLIKDLGDTKIKVDDLKEYTEVNFDITSKAIKAAETRLDALEEMLSDYPEVKAQVSANKANIAANASAIEQLKKDTQEKVDELNATIKENKDACEKAIEEINAAIKTLQEQVEVLSVRLTNIVAAPAKTIEMLSVTIGDSTFVNLQMDFKVAPAAFAKTIAEGFKPDNEGNVKVKLNLATGYTREGADKPMIDVDVVPFKVVSTKDGIISISANLSGIEERPAVKSGESHMDPVLTTRGVDEDLLRSVYVSIIVSGTDYEGMRYERISDPVRPIKGTIAEGENILTALRWFNGDKPVTVVGNAEDAIDSIRTYKKVSEKEYAVAVKGKELIVALEDLDWKVYSTFKETNVIKNYELKIPAEDNTFSGKAITVNEIAEMLGIEDYETLFAPSYCKVNSKTIKSEQVNSQIEWVDLNLPGTASTDNAVKKLFFSKNQNALEIGIEVSSLTGNNYVEKAEFVGAWYDVQSNDVVYGKIDTLENVNVRVLQRIGKHVSRNPATDPLTVQYAYNAGVTNSEDYAIPSVPIADHSNVEFSAVPWKAETDIARHENRAYLFDKDVTTYTEENTIMYNESTRAFGQAIAETPQSKFAKITLCDIPFADTEKQYQLVWLFEPYLNSKGIQAEDYLDYIDVTVKPYHEVVKVQANGVKGYVSMTGTNYFRTDIAITKDLYNAKVFGTDSRWNGGSNFATPAERQNWNTWYLTRFGDEDGNVKADTLSKRINGWNASNVTLRYPGSESGEGYLCVYFNDGTPKDIAGRTYTIHAVDTIDNVIAFDYTIPFTPLPIEANVAVRAGFPVDPTTKLPVINVGGSVNGEGDYVIDNINPENYFDFVNLDKIAKEDIEYLNVKFTSPAAISFYSEIRETTPKTLNQKTSPLNEDVTISWGNFKGTGFALDATPCVHTTAIQEKTSVYIKTDAPVVFDESSKNLEFTRTPGQNLEINALQGLRIEGIATKGEFVGFGQPGKDSWSNVLNENGTLRTASYPYGGNYVNYGLKEKPKCKGIEVTVGGVKWEKAQYDSIFTINNDDCGGTFKAESGIGEVVITLKYEWEYNFGVVPFERVITIK